ncbi:hypothetical protein DVJ78_17980 (plasmid) [Humibacter sp. BT305]|nr:hypothetical protein DVJ78_17980 [Humibacter sp. BT305]
MDGSEPIGERLDAAWSTEECADMEVLAIDPNDGVRIALARNPLLPWCVLRTMLPPRNSPRRQQIRKGTADLLAELFPG